MLRRGWTEDDLHEFVADNQCEFRYRVTHHQWHYADSFPILLIIPSSVSVAFLDRYSLSAKETLCDELWDRLRDGFFGTETGKAINAADLLQGVHHATVN